MYTTLRDYRFNKEIDDLRGSAVYGPTDEKLGKIDDVVFDSNSGIIRYLVVDTGGWLKSRRFLVPAEELHPSSTHDNDFTVSKSKAQIEQFPSLDDKVLEDKLAFEDYDKSHRSSWASDAGTRKPVRSIRLANFEDEIVRNRTTICEPRIRKVS